MDFSSISNFPGIYKMLNAQGDIIYVGKAKNLKKRVSSYFTKNHLSDLKTSVLVRQIVRIETIIAKTEQEALILENQLIKEFRPKYNILLKDDKNYPLVKVTTNELFPRIEIVRRQYKDRANYFGPFPTLGSTNKVKKILQELFLVRDCDQIINLEQRQKKCIYMDIERCIGPCVNKQIKLDYDKNIKELLLFLSGKRNSLLQKLQKEMVAKAKILEFEQAGKIKEKLEKLSLICQQQTVYLGPDKHFHVWADCENDAYYYAIVLIIIEGKLLFQKGFYSEKIEGFNKTHFLQQSFLTYYQKLTDLPDLILCGVNFQSSFSELLQLLPAKKIKCQAPKTGQYKDLVELAYRNACNSLNRLALSSKHGVELRVLSELQQQLQLSHYPQRILAIDISHLAGQDMVGAAVFFEDGKSAKANYRLFNIRSVTEQSNDPQAIYETVLRYLSLVQKEQAVLPDLILIDGGKAQLSYAYQAIQELGFKQIDLISIAKKNEEIYRLNCQNVLVLNKDNPVLLFLIKIRDEVHRFVISNQRKKRQKNLNNSKLTEIKGLGTQRINLLWQKYKTIEQIKSTSVEELALVGRMGIKLAKNLVEELSK